MAVCGAIKRDGERCKASVGPGEQWCYNHDPARSEERQRNASKAGKSGGNREIRYLKKQLEELVAEVLSGSLDRGAAVAVNQILNTRARLIELERKMKETEELEARLEALEATQKGQKGSGHWRGA